MKRIVLALIVSMLAVPALAGVTVDCAITDTNLVTVTYAMTGGDANLPRAFGLDIIADANISMDTMLPSADINNSDYYIFPGSIDVNDDGTIDGWGSPVAELDANTMIIEMGSLYADDDLDHNTPPPSSGWLIKFRVASGSPSVDIRENVDRGGVVMEDIDYAGSVVCGECAAGGGPYTISGTVRYMGGGLDGVTINGLPNSPIVTAGGGVYSDSVPEHWSGTVTPVLAGKGFKPANRSYPDVVGDQLNQDFCAFPGCWNYPTFCKGDGTGDGFVNTSDFGHYRDGFAKSYPGATYVAHACGDYNRDGVINTSDFGAYRDNFAKSPTPTCTTGDINGVYCP
jgi:hypothetical protein